MGVPNVPGCVTGGKDLSEALYMAKDALSACLCIYEDEKLELSPPSPIENIALPPNSTLALVDVDTLDYRRKTDNRAVRKNVSIPAWLSYQAELANLNISQVLQNALKEQLNISDVQ